MSRRGRKNHRSKGSRNKGSSGSKRSRKASERLKAKKEMQKKVFFGVVGAMIVALIITGVVLLKVLGGGGDDTEYGGVEYQQPNVSQNADTVEITSSELGDGKFHYYSYDSSGTTVRYFAVKGTDGSIHTAFDACDVCYREKKGYAQKGDQAQCRNCGNTYSINELGTRNSAGGGCWPGYLKASADGGKVTIKTADLKAGEYYFR